LQPERYVGRAPQQVHEFISEYLDPLVTMARPRAAAVVAEAIRV